MSAKRVRFFLVSIASVSVVAILMLVYMMTDAANTVARQHSVQLMERAIASELKTLETVTFDYGYWEAARDWIVERDDDAVLDNIGVGAVDGPLFDYIYILDPDGTPAYAYERDAEASDTTLIDGTLASHFYARVEAELSLDDPYDVVSSFSMKHGQVSMVAAGRVQPPELGSLTTADLPVLITVKTFSPGTLATMAEGLMIPGAVTIHDTVQETLPAGTVQLPLTASNQNLAFLRWTPPIPSDELLRRVLPIVVFLSVVLLGGSVAAGHIFSRSTSELKAAYVRARTDQLTGLYNRHGLRSMVDETEFQEALASGNIAVVYLDLNGFKILNDNAGHDVGDRALIMAAGALRNSVSELDILVRYGGDEFIGVIVGDLEQDVIMERATQITEAVRFTIMAQGRVFPVGAAVGVAIGEKGKSFSDIIKEADDAMYIAKRDKSVVPVLFSDDAVSAVACNQNRKVG